MLKKKSEFWRKISLEFWKKNVSQIGTALQLTFAYIYIYNIKLTTIGICIESLDIIWSRKISHVLIYSKYIDHHKNKNRKNLHPMGEIGI